MRSLAKNSLYNILYQTTGLIFPLISSIYVSRILMEDGIGKVAYAQNIASYFASAAALGFPTYGIREIARIGAEKNAKNKAFSEMFAINAISTTVFVLAYILLLATTQPFREEWGLYLCAGLTIAFNYANISWLYQGQEDYGYITARSAAVKVLSLAALFLFVKEKDDYIRYALISSLGTACNYCFDLFHARKYVQIRLHDLDLKRHMRPLLILAATGFFGNIYNKIDVTMLGAMTNDAVVGYYSNAHKVVGIVIMCCNAISMALMPRLSFFYQNDRKELSRLVDLGVHILLLLVIPATAGFVLVSRNVVLLLYGERFLPAAATLVVFAPMLIVRTLGDLLCYQLLVSMGQEKKRLYASIWAAVVNVILNAILIPVWKHNGAAAASVISEVVVNGILMVTVMKMIKIHIDVRAVFKMIFATLGMVIIVFLIQQYVASVPLSTILSVTVGGVTYFAIGLALRIELLSENMNKILEKFLYGRIRFR